MSTPVLSFNAITIRRMPGFEHGGFSIETFSPGVCIVYGPNASGKTTLSKVMSILLRANETTDRSMSFFAVLNVDGRMVTIDYDYGRVHVQTDGVESAYTAFAPSQTGNRYLLALHDLIRAEDKDIAQEILREASGGYDINSARDQLQYGKPITGKSSNVFKNFQQARTEYQAADQEERILLGAERSLVQLKWERDAAKRAESESRLLQNALRFQRHKDMEHACAERVRMFPPGIARLLGNEAERLDTLKKARDARNQERAAAELCQAQATVAIDAFPLPEEGVSSEVIQTLRSKLPRLHDVHRRVETQKNQVTSASARQQETWEQIGGVGVEIGHPAALNLAFLSELCDLAREEEDVHAAVAVQQELREWLGPELVAEDTEPLDTGIRVLTRWVACQQNNGETQSRPFFPWAVGAGAVALSCILLSLNSQNRLWLVGLLVAVGLIAYGVASRKKAPTGTQLLSLQEEWATLNLDGPGQWAADEVQRLLVALRTRRSEADLQKQRMIKWANMDQKQQGLLRQQEGLEAKKIALSERVGIQFSGDFHKFYLKADRFLDYLKASTDRKEAHAEYERLIQDEDHIRGELNTTLEAYGFERSNDVDRLQAQVENLDRSRQELRQAQDERDRAEKELERIVTESRRIEDDIQGLFQRVGLTAEEEERTLQDWLAQHAAYHDEKRIWEECKRDLAAIAVELEAHPGLKEQAPHELERQISEQDAQAAKWDALNTKIIQIEHDIENAKSNTQREEKSAHLLGCKEAIRAQRDADQYTATGQALVDLLAEKERTRSRPGVFSRARDLFLAFTQGRYSLEIDSAGNSPRFRGIDNVGHVGRNLDELSAGTRLQLLIAVRMAYLEQQERGGYKVPFFLDETLGNSDELRADQIIATAIEICRQGRQVFYFTAQHDEVGKWRRILDDNQDIQHTLIDLAEVRNFLESERVPEYQYELPSRREIPPPEGMDWKQYGRALGVGRLADIDNPGYTHLWFVMDEVNILYRLLKNGINRWGQLEALMQFEVTKVLHRNASEYIRAQAAVTVISQALELRAIGRGRLVDRQVLLQSGDVGDAFIDGMSQLAQQLGGDGQQLLAQLEIGAIRGFGRTKINNLRQHFENSRYIDPQPRLDHTEICDRIRPYVFSHLESNLLTDEYVQWLVRQVIGAEAI